MSPERFLEQFGYLAEAPNGIAKLRELVLYLAVRGKLVPQDPVEDSAHEALKRARALLGAAAAAKRRSSWKTSKPFSPAEKLPSVPSNWCWARVNDTGFYTNGLAFKPSDWKDRGLPIIRIQNLTDSTKPFNFAQGDFPDEVLVRQGDLLVSWSATLDVFSWQLRDAVLNQHIFLVQPCSLLVDKGFLYWLLKNAIREMAESEHAHGLVMTHINRGPFLAHPVAIPPLAEQQRIVAKVDQLMTLCDELEAKQNQRAETHVHLIRAAHHPLTQPRDHAEFRAAWRRIRDNFDRLHTTIDAVKALRQSILQLAVQGKLVPQDPNDEPASVLLEKIRAEKERLIAAGKIKRTKPLPSIAQEGVAFDAPQGWKWTRLGLVGLCATGKTPDTRNPDYYGGSTPFIGPGQITEDSRVLTAEKWVSESGKSETLSCAALFRPQVSC